MPSISGSAAFCGYGEYSVIELVIDHFKEFKYMRELT